MQCARAVAALSRAERKKVGAILVSPHGIIAEGFNGTPSGFDNVCEIFKEHTWVKHRRPEMPYDELHCTICQKILALDCLRIKERDTPCSMTTKPEVIHAEANAIAKVAKSTNSSAGATLYCTLSPCFDCAKQIIQAGIVRVVYAEQYPYAEHNGPVRAMGLELLKEAKIKVEKL